MLSSPADPPSQRGELGALAVAWAKHDTADAKSDAATFHAVTAD